MFNGCISLTNIEFDSNFNVQNIQDDTFKIKIFDNCPSLLKKNIIYIIKK